MPPSVDPVLSGSAGPDGLRNALRSAPVRAPVRRALASLLAPGAVLGPVHLERVKLKPGRKLSVWGRAAVLDGAGRRWRVPVAATWVPPTTMSSAPLDALPPAGPLRAWQAVDEAAGLELLASPFDPAAPELVELIDPAAVPERPLVSTVRYRPRQRHVLRYDAVGGSGRPCWAKLVPGRDGAAAAATATALADGLAGSREATVLRPLRLLAGGAVLFPHAPGRPLPALLGAGRPWPEEPLRRCGAALRQLHHLPLEALPTGRVAALEEELAGVARAGEHVAALDRPAAQLFEGVLDAARSALGTAEVAPGHGDCKLDHLWLDRRTVTFIDVDSAVMADPARDLGKLLADLRWWTIRTATPGLDAARAAVAAGYDAGGVPERWSRATAWEGLLLAKAVVRRTSLLEADWTARTRAGLRDSAAVLDARRTERVPVAAVV